MTGCIRRPNDKETQAAVTSDLTAAGVVLPTIAPETIEQNLSEGMAIPIEELAREDAYQPDLAEDSIHGDPQNTSPTGQDSMGQETTNVPGSQEVDPSAPDQAATEESGFRLDNDEGEPMHFS